MTIDQGVLGLTLALTFGLVVLVFVGWQRLQSAARLRYYLLRRRQMVSGWRLILLGAVVGLAALGMLMWGKPAAYRLFPPTPSLTPSPTVTLTPTITQTPTITLTPAATAIPSPTSTSTATGTPSLPGEAAVLVALGTVTPNPDVAFSTIEFASQLFYPPVNPLQTFQNPSGTLYGIFTYDLLDLGVPWTALWYRGEEIVCFESQPWDSPTGGYGFTECTPDTWLPGEYEVRIFVGDQWKVSSRFTVEAPGAASATPTP